MTHDTSRCTALKDEFSDRDARAILQFLKRRDYIVSTDLKDSVPAVLRDASPLSAVDIVEAVVPGLIVYKEPLGAVVKKGQVLCEIVSPMDGSRAEVVAKTDGVFFARRLRRLCQRGQVICKVSGTIPIRTGNLLV